MSAVSAAFDVLTIAARVERKAGGVAAPELHVFAYLSCLLSVYEKRPAEEWGYGFVATPAGAPFATEVAVVTDQLRAAGLLADRGPVFTVSVSGRAELDFLSDLPSQGVRARYLEASTATASILPLPSIADALSFEPQLRRALSHLGSRDELLDEVGTRAVRKQFSMVSDALQASGSADVDLLVPAVVWLTALSEAGMETP